MLEELERDLLDHRNAKIGPLVRAVASGDPPELAEISAELADAGCSPADFCELVRIEIDARANESA